MSEDYGLKLQKLKYLEQAEEMRSELPHLYGWKFYPWARKFFETTNRMNILVAANQISKSSTMIRKAIHLATATELWPKLWVRPPLTFWYAYPTKDVATAEFEKKWIPEFMPKGKMKDHPVFGWKAKYQQGKIHAVDFKAGPTIFFKTYAQDVQDLQTGTVWALFCFVAGTKVFTARGELSIEEVRPGDLVLSQHGWREVTKTMSREAEVITRRFKSGRTITATPDHLFLTENRGWVQFGSLLPGDACFTLPECQISKRLLRSTALFFAASRSTKTIALGIISAVGVMANCTWRFGRPLISARFQRVTSFITGILTRSTIASTIWNSLRGKSTHASTNSPNGGRQRLTRAFAKNAGRLSQVGAQSFQSLAIAACRAAESLTSKLLSASNALNFSLLAKTSRRDSVQGLAQAEINPRKVYDLKVSGARSFFANGTLVHNCDEELPEELYSELAMRLAATDGYFNAAFTATLGQEFWRCAIEERGQYERFRGACKQQISMYDCLYYDDGTRSPWSEAQIERARNSCKSEAEVLRRVFGRFVVDEGLKYPAFVRSKHFAPSHPVPNSWIVFIGADPGSGGENHPAAICVLAVSPDYTKGRVIGGWRGDGQVTTAADVVAKVKEICAQLPQTVAAVRYDYACRDFYTIAQEMGVDVEPADKSHSRGEQVINVLFRNDMVYVYDLPELEPLAIELSTLKLKTPKTKAKDDFADAFRYACTAVPWDWSAINGKKETAPVREPGETDIRRQMALGSDEALIGAEDELAAWDELMQNDGSNDSPFGGGFEF